MNELDLVITIIFNSYNLSKNKNSELAQAALNNKIIHLHML